MYHSVIFQDGNVRKNTWDNWRLIPSSRPTVVQPTPLFKNVDIPGKDGTLDITDYLIGRPTYSDRKGSFEFYVSNDGTSWTARRASIASFLNGKKMKMILEDEPQYYYYGRFFFKEWRSEPQFSKVVIDYQVGPYRYLLDGKEAGL